MNTAPAAGPTPGRQFYDEQIVLLQQGRTDELVAAHYAEEAVLVSFAQVVRGRRNLLDFFRSYRANLGDFEVRTLDRFVETGDTIFFEATIRTGRGEARVYDAFVLRDGRATHHFAGSI